MVSASSNPDDQLANERILGISFFNGSAAAAVEKHQQAGGYLVVPASPALLKLKYDEEYRRALTSADLALADSGMLVRLWKLVTGRRLQKISGLSYLKSLLARADLQKRGKTFWVLPSAEAKVRAITLLSGQGFEIDEEDCYVTSPDKTSAQDHALLLQAENRHPAHIVIAIGTGTQEKLGLYLRDYLLYRPAIHCVGAALGFLTGDEPSLPGWADRHNLGWLSRLFSQPRMFFPRLFIAVEVAIMILKNRSELPPLRTRWSDL